MIHAKGTDSLEFCHKDKRNGSPIKGVNVDYNSTSPPAGSHYFEP